jgi:hypothetical protein
MLLNTRSRGRAAAAVAVTIIVAAGCNAGQSGRPDVATEQQQAAEQAKHEQTVVERGKYLVTVGGCTDCHTPWKMGPNGPEPDQTRFLSGHPQDMPMPASGGPQPPWMWMGAATNTAFRGPWGTSYATNLTPDKDTGIGLWTEQVFINTLKTGRQMGVGRPILPPMPWSNYGQMTDDDLRAVFAYLRTIEPKRNDVPDAVVAAPPAPAEQPGPAGQPAPGAPPVTPPTQ